MFKIIRYLLFPMLLILLGYTYLNSKESTKDEVKVVETVAQIRERHALEMAINQIYQEAGEELSRKVQKIITDAKEDIDFILTLKPSQVMAINQEESPKKLITPTKINKKITYMPLPKFRKYPSGIERKEIFFKYFLYLIEKRNQEILKMRKRVIAWRRERENLSNRNKKTVLYLAEKYKVEKFNIEEYASWNKLLMRLDIIPASLALAQAAKESLWGTSRFARYGYNYYGQHCFSRGCGIVPKKRGKNKFEVTAFKSPRESLKSYVHNLNTHPAYQMLRKIRNRQRAKGKKIKGLLLVNALEKYSERGLAYIKDLKSLIRYNKLAQHDIH